MPRLLTRTTPSIRCDPRSSPCWRPSLACGPATQAPSQVLKTPATELFGIKHPVLLAGMNVAAGPRLAAAVTNAGGMGVIGTSYQQSCAVRVRAHTLHHLP